MEASAVKENNVMSLANSPKSIHCECDGHNLDRKRLTAGLSGVQHS